VQVKRRRWLLAAVLLLGSRSAAAQVAEVETAHQVFHEQPSGSKMTVYSPSADVEVTPVDMLTVRAGWVADVVSGASVAVKAGPTYPGAHPGVDVVSSASVHDLRNEAHGGFTFRHDGVSLTGGYAFSTENDYISNRVSAAATTEPFDRNTQLGLAYTHEWGQLCNRVQTVGEAATGFRALEDSAGCFTSGALRVTDDLSIDQAQASWTQAWTAAFVTDLVCDLEVRDGFLGNPYRSVVLGDGVVAQEHDPGDRIRQAVTLRASIYLKPIEGALRLSARGYRDNWGVQSVTGELGLEKYVAAGWRLMLRGRVHDQTGAFFWSDDYTAGSSPLGPKGEYWTGDRALSPFWSWLGGVRAVGTITPDEGRLLGMFTKLTLGASADVEGFHYSQYTLGGASLGNVLALFAGLSLGAEF
jgi:hypothetical protein